MFDCNDTAYVALEKNQRISHAVAKVPQVFYLRKVIVVIAAAAVAKFDAQVLSAQVPTTATVYFTDYGPSNPSYVKLGFEC